MIRKLKFQLIVDSRNIGLLPGECVKIKAAGRFMVHAMSESNLLLPFAIEFQSHVCIASGQKNHLT
jgi:hypothetical protein